MKKNVYQSIFVIALTILSLSATAQEWGGTRPVSFWDHWSVNVNAGYTSYFGDLSYHDDNISGKLNNESGLGMSMLVTKHIDKKFGVSGQLLWGHLKGGNNNGISFNTEFIEYNIQARIDLIRLLLPDRNPKFGFEGFAGIGQTWFNAQKYELEEGVAIQDNHRNTVPELVFFGGAGMHYHISESFAITASLSLRQLQNDKLDNLIKNNDFDYISYLSVGITYYIDSFLSRPLKNKARLAHSTKHPK